MERLRAGSNVKSWLFTILLNIWRNHTIKPSLNRRFVAAVVEEAVKSKAAPEVCATPSYYYRECLYDPSARKASASRS